MDSFKNAMGSLGDKMGQLKKNMSSAMDEGADSWQPKVV